MSSDTPDIAAAYRMASTRLSALLAECVTALSTVGEISVVCVEHVSPDLLRRTADVSVAIVEAVAAVGELTAAAAAVEGGTE